MSRSFFLRRFAESAARDPIELTPIGQVQNRIRKPRPHGWETVESRIELTLPEASAMLHGLADYSHLIVIYWIDRLGSGRPRPPHLRPGGLDTPVQGVLATRSQLRPNPLGVTVVPCIGIDGPMLRVRGLDAINGTPVLDIKPYIPFYDSVPAARVPPWILPDARSG